MAEHLKNNKAPIIWALFLIHLIGHCVLGYLQWIDPFELFNLMLLGANGIVVWIMTKRKQDLLLGAGIMIILASHALIGQKIAPDSLTSGAILMVNILILYVGINIFEHLSNLHAISFTTSYFILFQIFIRQQENAEALFMLALMGLAATARDLRLLTYFWALVLSFTYCQPYAWPALILFYFFLKMFFSAKDDIPNPAALTGIACGMVLLILVLFPILTLLIKEDPRSMINLLRETVVQKALLRTMGTATLSTAILAVFCIPMAYGISRLQFYGKTMLLSFMDLPIIIPQSAAGIALLAVFGRQQFIGEALYSYFGLRIDSTLAGIVLAQMFVSLPFLVKTALSAFDAVPASLEQSARTLGANSFGAFFRIALPLASRGICTGLILAWARAAGEFGAVLFIAPNPQTAPITVYNRFMSVGIIQTAPLVTILILFSIIMFFILQTCLKLTPVVNPGRSDR